MRLGGLAAPDAGAPPPIGAAPENHAADMGGRNTLGWSLLGLLAVVLSFALPVSWVLDSYFKIDVPASLMFFGDDGWCVKFVEGVGVHCFGDFNERFQIDPNYFYIPWPNNLELAPVGPFLTMAANGLAAAITPKAVLFLVIGIYSACVLAPAVWASRGKIWPLKAVIILLIGVATLPFFSTMDRLNIVAVTVPLLLLFLLALAAGETRWIVASILALTLVKPQFAILYLALVASRNFRAALFGLLASVGVVGVLIVGAGSGDLDRIPQWIRAVRGYGAQAEIYQRDSPINLSLSRVLYVFGDAAGAATRSVIGTDWFEWLRSPGVLLSFQVAILVIAASILAIRGRTLPPLLLGIALVVLSTRVVGEYVAVYYTVVVLPVMALIIRNPERSPAEDGVRLRGALDDLSIGSRLSPLIRWTLLTACVLDSSLMILPKWSMSIGTFQVDADHRVYPMAPLFGTVAWMIFLGITCLASIGWARIGRRRGARVADRDGRGEGHE